MVQAMRKRFLFLLGLASVSAALACGGDDNKTDGGGTDATTDAPPAKDAGGDAAADANPSDATADAPTTTDGGDGGTVVQLGCTNPDQCDGGASLCCATIDLNGGTPPNCNVASISSTCTSTCNTVLQFSCNASDTVRLCNKPADCTEAAYDKCCTFQTGNQSETFCANAVIASSADAGCM